MIKKNNKESVFSLKKFRKLFFVSLFLFACLLLLNYQNQDLLALVNSGAPSSGTASPGLFDTSSRGGGWEIFNSFGGLGPGVDWGGSYIFYVGGGIMSSEEFEAIVAAYVEQNVDPHFEGSTEDFVNFLIQSHGQADLLRYVSTIPEFPKEPLTPSQTQTQPTAVEKSIDQTSAGTGGQSQFVGENPAVAADALLVSILAGGDTNQSGVVFLDDPVANSGTILLSQG